MTTHRQQQRTRGSVRKTLFDIEGEGERRAYYYLRKASRRKPDTPIDVR